MSILDQLREMSMIVADTGTLTPSRSTIPTMRRPQNPTNGPKTPAPWGLPHPLLICGGDGRHPGDETG